MLMRRMIIWQNFDSVGVQVIQNRESERARMVCCGYKDRLASRDNGVLTEANHKQQGQARSTIIFKIIERQSIVIAFRLVTRYIVMGDSGRACFQLFRLISAAPAHNCFGVQQTSIHPC